MVCGRSRSTLTPCPLKMGCLLKYLWGLLKLQSDNLKVLDSGFTTDTAASFHNLTASTQYIVKVFVVTISGWNPQAYLSINTSSSDTVPEAVRDLTVYKRGRNMLGLRWAAPEATYGKLKSFTVTHTMGNDVISHTVEPTSCIVWPNLFCNTINNLRPNRRYNITVRARNVVVDEDGTEAFV
uniref:Fibronectin type-III domain-containing protein n=1 Tax=Graphocephala atropunctata TaxID=36148 RepID=A0A1B6KWS4_9HEMI